MLNRIRFGGRARIWPADRVGLGIRSRRTPAAGTAKKFEIVRKATGIAIFHNAITMEGRSTATISSPLPSARSRLQRSVCE